MIAGRNVWIVIWIGILLLGLLALVPSIIWGRRSRWENADEVFRAVGAVVVSAGMLLVLLDWAAPAGEILLGLAVLCFGAAFWKSRKNRKSGGRGKGRSGRSRSRSEQD